MNARTSPTVSHFFSLTRGTSNVLSVVASLALALGSIACQSPAPEASGTASAGAAASEGTVTPRPAEGQVEHAAAGGEAAGGEAAGGEAAPAAECTGVRPTATQPAPSAGTPPECATCLGTPAPTWALEDFQTQSCGFGNIYGLDQFRGKVTLVVLLSASCGYCLGQAEKLEEMWWELKAAGHDVAFVVINQAASVGQQSALLERTSFPLFQSTSAVDGWAIHDGGKDDFYIYDAEGMLRASYPAHTEITTTLSLPQGYGHIRDAVLHILGEPVALPGNGVSTGVAPGHEGHNH